MSWERHIRDQVAHKGHVQVRYGVPWPYGMQKHTWHGVCHTMRFILFVSFVNFIAARLRYARCLKHTHTHTRMSCDDGYGSGSGYLVIIIIIVWLFSENITGYSISSGGNPLSMQTKWRIKLTAIITVISVQARVQSVSTGSSFSICSCGQSPIGVRTRW